VQKIFISTIIILLACNLFGQSIKGIVLDQLANPIPNAYISSPKDEVLGVSNNAGLFELTNININDTIIISSLGFKSSKHIINSPDYNNDLQFILDEDQYRLEEVYVTREFKAVHEIRSIDLRVHPVNSAQEVMTKVPGLFISQHAGGGKAEQIFLRGFDLDHGTDIAITADGIPVNMVSHAHGQGYADLHFIIPETLENINFGKGPYYAHKGNLNTAGYIDFKTKDKINSNTIGLEVGDFATLRGHGLFNLLGDNSSGQHAYIATEYITSDGPFESPQNFSRFNALGKYHKEANDGSRYTFLVSHFRSQWDASGQIPQRLVNDGSITRFGSVDDTEGGNTGRTNFSFDMSKVLTENSFVRTQAYYSIYDFELFSNFTFFLVNPITGDQIRQRENRMLGGHVESHIDELPFNYSVGFALRHDNINDNELAYTINRTEVQEQLSLGDINESNISVHGNFDFTLGDLVVNPGLRLDYFRFDLTDKNQPSFSNTSTDDIILLPKLNLQYSLNTQLQLYLKTGIGFHSNDTRVVVSNQLDETLPKAAGVDLGVIWQLGPNFWLNSALWYLRSEQEFVYVGDEAIVEPSGESLRRGVDLSASMNLNSKIFLTTSINYSHARSTEESSGNDFIPLAPMLTSSGSLTYQPSRDFSLNMRYRYIEDRPANEDNSIVAEGYFIADLAASLKKGNVTFGLSINNLFNSEWNEAQFATRSRLFDEIDSVEELHFTPGSPIFLKGSVSYSF